MKPDTNDTQDEFRTRLRSALTGRGMTQTELARRLGVRDATVSDWFNRGTMPGGAVMLRLPELLGVDGHWLLTGKHRRMPRASRSGSGGERPIAGSVRAQAVDHLEEALELLRDVPTGDTEPGYLRVRTASEGERRALDALDRHQGQTESRSRRKKRG